MKKYLTDLLKKHAVEFKEEDNCVFVNGLHFVCLTHTMVVKKLVLLPDFYIIEMDIDTIEARPCDNQVSLSMSLKSKRSNNYFVTFINKQLENKNDSKTSN